MSETFLYKEDFEKYLRTTEFGLLNQLEKNNGKLSYLQGVEESMDCRDMEDRSKWNG